MVYRVIGTMSGSSLDGLDIAFAELQEVSGKWTYQLRNAACYPYSDEWKKKLSGAQDLSARDYAVLHERYGRYCGELINRFIDQNSIAYEVQLIASHGHTTFHLPANATTGQLGSGAAIAAVTGINVVSDLRVMDMALGGQGAPIVPIGEKLLLGDYRYFLNLGGIANISVCENDRYTAFDVCPASRVMNMLAGDLGKEFDDGGDIAAAGTVHQELLTKLGRMDYYDLPYPKSLANTFGTEILYPIIKVFGLSVQDEMRTYAEHIAEQITRAVTQLQQDLALPKEGRMLVSGGGAKNKFLMDRLSQLLSEQGVSVEIPSADLIDYKEAIVMALFGVLRWREEYNVIASVTGARRNSIGGAVWIGQEA